MRSKIGILLFGTIAMAAQTTAVSAAAAAETPPVQRWWGPSSFPMFMLVPRSAEVSQSSTSLGANASAGWRLIWDGSSTLAGQMMVRLELAVTPKDQRGQQTEVMQIGASRDPSAVSSCLSYGLKGRNARRRPDRIINGQRFTVWSNGDGGMSQDVDATDLRAVSGGVCYAVDRYSYAVTASDPNPAVRLREAVGAEALDAALSGLRLGRVRAGNVLMKTQ